MKLAVKKQAPVPEPKDTQSNLGKLPLWVRIVGYVIITLVAFVIFVPLLLMIIVSITDDVTLAANGYSFFPEKFSLEAYRYIFDNGAQLGRSYLVTIFVTVVGWFWSLLAMTMFSYVVSRDSFPWRMQLLFFVFFTMLFSGGMLPTYIIVSSVLNLRDTIWALILPGSIAGMYIMMMKTYMRTSIPPAVVESAEIDGAGDFRCYLTIVLPMSLPIVATISLFVAIKYWNDWYNAFLYVIQNDNIIPIQLLLKRIENDIEFLANSQDMSFLERQQLESTLPTESIRMAMVMMVVGPLLLAFPFFQKYFVKGITVGAVKG